MWDQVERFGYTEEERCQELPALGTARLNVLQTLLQHKVVVSPSGVFPSSPFKDFREVRKRVVSDESPLLYSPFSGVHIGLESVLEGVYFLQNPGFMYIASKRLFVGGKSWRSRDRGG
jgi:hypothetical protein